MKSTINQVVSRRFVKKQQMQRTPRGAHLLLQTWTKVLNEELHDVFRGWYQKLRPQRRSQNAGRLDSDFLTLSRQSLCRRQEAVWP